MWFWFIYVACWTPLESSFCLRWDEEPHCLSLACSSFPHYHYRHSLHSLLAREQGFIGAAMTARLVPVSVYKLIFQDSRLTWESMMTLSCLFSILLNLLQFFTYSFSHVKLTLLCFVVQNVISFHTIVMTTGPLVQQPTSFCLPLEQILTDPDPDPQCAAGKPWGPGCGRWWIGYSKPWLLY